MKHYRKELQILLNETVRNYATKSTDWWMLHLKDIDTDDVYLLVRLLWECYDRTWDAITTDAYEIYIKSHICSFLKGDTENAPRDLAEMISLNLLNFFGAELQKLIDDACLEQFIEARDYPDEN